MKKNSKKTICKAFFHVSFTVMALLLAAGPILLGNAAAINSFLGIETQIGSGANGNTYFDTQFKSMEEVRRASLDIIEESMAEGAVLLKNDNDALPLSEGDTVNMYGAASYYSVHTGQGSSGVESGALNDRVTLYNGLTNAGLSVNTTLDTWYKNNTTNAHLGVSPNSFIGASSQETQYVVKDIAWASINTDAKNQAAKTAIMVIARTSGEAVDLYMDTTMDDGNTRVIVNKQNNNNAAKSVGDSLELAANEKDVLRNLKALKDAGTIDNIVVLMNSASPLQCEFVDDVQYGIDACMWVGTLGTNGANAIGKLLTGKVNPSGRTANTFWANSKYNPVYYNVGSIEYGNSSQLSTYFSTLGQVNNKFYVAYQEGIYMGYKYTETRYEDVVTGRENVGSFDYEAAVTYPFGYGLSYTQFAYSNMKVKENSKEDIYTVTVDVRNIGDYDGAEVVQIYAQKPYTQTDIANGVEKAAVELVGYEKVYLNAGETKTVSVEVEGKYLAAYDAEVEQTYVIGSQDSADKYLLTAAKDAHHATNNILRWKETNGYDVDTDKMTSNVDRDLGDENLVWSKYFKYDTTTYSTNEFIESENENFVEEYDGQEANYGVSTITNQFEDVDFKKAGIFSESEESQVYISRSDWTGTYGKRITLTANAALKEAQKNPNLEQDDIEYPAYGEIGFFESETEFDEIKLIYLRGKDYNDPLWNTLLDRITWEETCTILQEGLRRTNGIESIAAPSTSQQNGAIAPVHSREWRELPSQSAFRGFAEELDPENKGQLPPVFVCNGIVASSFNKDLAYRLGVQTGEEAAWAGYNGIYGIGVNIHRGNYCGRTFEYYSEDGFLTGVAAGYETAGLHKLGVFVLVKHAILNDQETHRAGLNVWANEQSIREIYVRALEVAIDIDRDLTPNSVLGVMTGMNRIGAKWTGGQGFINTVLRAECGMRGYAVSDYNSSRPYMSPIQGVLYGNDLPDGNPAGARGGEDYDGNNIYFSNYAEGYGELAWAMRVAVKNILYTVVNSNSMNGVTGSSSFTTITPAWQTAVPIVTRVSVTIFIWAVVFYFFAWVKDGASKAEEVKEKVTKNLSKGGKKEK